MTIAYAWEMATRPILPYDFRDSARLIHSALEGYQQEADQSLGLDRQRALARELEEVTGQLWQRAGALADRFTLVEHSDNLEAEAEARNIALKGLASTLNPLLTSVVGRYGQDSYGLSALRRWVPGLADAGKLRGLDAATGDHMLWWSKLIRERNRVTDDLAAELEIARGQVR